MTQDPLIGAEISGRYTVTGLIGEGGVGLVYHAVEAPFGRPVAIKVLLDDFADCDHTAGRFVHEARIISHLRHPHVVTLLDSGTLDDGRLFFVMEYLNGGHLGEVIAAGMSLADVLAVAQQICRGLAAAHARGVVHRDLKPENVLFEELHGDGETLHIKVVDFGMAQTEEASHWCEPVPIDEPGTRVGTPSYMSPEQAYGTPIDGRADLYAVGVLLFEMLTGHKPFRGENKTATLLAHLHDSPPAMSVVAPERPVPFEVERLVSKLLEKDAADRPSSASAVAARLGVLIDMLKPPSRRLTPVIAVDDDEIDWKPARGRMALAACALLGCGGIIGAFV